jgi:hypothetical protein
MCYKTKLKNLVLIVQNLDPVNKVGQPVNLQPELRVGKPNELKQTMCEDVLISTIEEPNVINVPVDSAASAK